MLFKDLDLTAPESEPIIIDFNNQQINIKHYLEINKKLDLVSWIINQSADDLKFYNVGKLDIFLAIGLVQNYSDIEFSAEDLQDIPALYDSLAKSGLMALIIQAIPFDEYKWICDTLQNTVDSIYKYQNSVMGILDTVTADYENLNFDVEKLQQNISNPENLTLLKDVVTKLG